MATPEFILFAGDATWRAARVDGDAVAWVALPSSEPAAIVAALRGHGYTGRPVVLAVASDDCLAARIRTDGLPRGDGRALLYRFEEKLPLSAEQVVADFITFDPPLPGGEAALAVCVRLDRFAPVVAGLEAAGVAVRSIIPATLAAAQDLSAHEGGDVVLLLAEPEAMVSVVTLRGGRPVDWAWLPLATADVKLHSELLAAEIGTVPRVVAAGLAGEWVERMIDGLSQVIGEQDLPPADAAARRCAAVLRGGPPPWADLRRDALAVADRWRQYRRSLNAALAAAAALLLAITVALLLRSARYSRVEADSRAAIAAAFRDHFPGWTTPANVRAVIDAEHRKATQATAGDAGGSSGGSAYGSALTAFRDVLADLPADGVSLDRVSVQDTSLELDGRSESLERVDAVAAAARRSGMDVSPPQTRRDPGGAWAFVVQGVRLGGPSPGRATNTETAAR